MKIRFGLDKDGNRVFIDNTYVKYDYFCPVCGEKLVLRKGDKRVHHFAHPPHSTCTDSWHYDMSDWHMRWQDRFPKETQEIVKRKDGQKHRADVLIEEKKVVFEFQHSSLSPEEFSDRNDFYTSLGYKVIWIFDLVEQYDNDAIGNHKGDVYRWKRPKRTFNNFIPKENPNVELYFQISIPPEENDYYQELKKFKDDGYDLDSKDRLYILNHQYAEIELIKITWASDDGFEYFATDGYSYDEKDIIDRFIESTKEKEKTVRLGDLADFLKEMYSKDHTTYYFGCPRSMTHICGSNNIDIPDEKYEETFPCSECEYRIQDKDYNPMCKKRFIDLNLSGNTQVELLSKTNDGFISQLAYEDEHGKHIIDLPVYENPLNQSACDLWKENNYKVAIFKNTRTGMFIKIISNPVEQIMRYGTVKGYFSKDQYSFTGPFTELYGVNKPEWICVWGKK